MQVFHLHERNPLHPYPSVSNNLLMPCEKKVRMAIEPVRLQAFNCPVHESETDFSSSLNKRQPWLSSVIFSHESKQRIFARSKLNRISGHCINSGSDSPHSPHAQHNSPVLSRISTATVDSVLALRALTFANSKKECTARHVDTDATKDYRNSTSAGPVSQRVHQTICLQIGSLAEKSNIQVVKSNNSRSFVDSAEKDLQLVNFPTLSSYLLSNGQESLFIKSKAAELTPRAPYNSANSRNYPPTINLCDPVVPPLKLPVDTIDELRDVNQKNIIVSERKLRFSVPSDTFYRIRGNQTQRTCRGYIPYPLSVSNVSYPMEAAPLVPKMKSGHYEPRAPMRSTKPTGNTPRSPASLSRTVFIPANQETVAASATQVIESPKPKFTGITSDMQVKGMLVAASLPVSACLLDPNSVNCSPLYVGSGPVSKASAIGDKMWSKTAKIAAASDK